MSLDRRRRILVNDAEALTDAALREAATDLGLRVDAKVRLADAVDIDRSGPAASLTERVARCRSCPNSPETAHLAAELTWP